MHVEVCSDIFTAIEQEQFSQAITLCLRRFETRGVFWLYCARLGAELMLRTARYEAARVKIHGKADHVAGGTDIGDF